MAKVPDRQARMVTGRVPVMRETWYDQISSFVIAGAWVLIGLAIVLVAVWLSNFLDSPVTVGTQMVSGDGGFEDGAEDQTLDVESPEDPTDDPSLSNDQQDTEMQEVLDRVVSFSAASSQFELPNEYTGDTSGGTPGSAEGTGGKPLGSGRGRGGGVPREQRWFVEFGDSAVLKIYGQQLDHFGIEIGVVYPDRRVLFVSGFSGTPQIRESEVNSQDQRLFMSWKQGGERVQADRELLKKAGVTDLEGVQILHFYPAETEAMMAQLETEFAGRPSAQIRRTRFRVAGGVGDFHFVVESQKYR